MSRESSEPRRWTLALVFGRNVCSAIPQLDKGERVEVMPVSEHEALREAARAVLETLDRSSSFNVDQVDALRAALGQKERNGE